MLFRFVVTLFWGTFFALVPIFADSSGITYHVATTGNDATGDGSSGNPWKTIQKAADTMTAGDTCLIHGGVYRETVIPANSGISGSPITFQAAAGETVTVNGCDIVTGWALHSGSIYKKAGLPLKLDVLMNQVFVNGEQMIFARWPSKTNSDIWDMEYYQATGGSQYGLVDTNHLTQPDDYWKGGILCWCVMGLSTKAYDGGGWYQARMGITDYSQSSQTITMDDYDGCGQPSVEARYFICNKLECLDAAREWYYDTGAATLYLQTPNGDDPNRYLVEAKQRLYGFNLSDKAYINIKDINLFAGSILCQKDTNHCIIDNIKADHYWWSLAKSKNWTYKDSGIIIRGSYNTLQNSTLIYSSDDGVVLGGTHNSVVNNLIHDTGYAGPVCMGIRVEGGWNLVSHNTVYNTGKNCCGSVGTGLFHSVIEYNRWYNHSKLANDDGATYFTGLAAENTEIHHNIMYGPRPSCTYSMGLYFDEDCNGVIVYRNIVYSPYTVSSLQVNNPCEYSFFSNNTLYSYSKIWADWTRSYSLNVGCYFQNNISTQRCDIANWGAVYDHNLTSGNPRYTNAEADDFTLRSDSPCIDAGIAIEGITDGYVGRAPDIGALEYGASDWQCQVGHNFANPPVCKWTTANLRYRNRVENPSFERISSFPNDPTFDRLDGWTKYGSDTSTGEVVKSLTSATLSPDLIRHAVAKQCRHSAKLSSGAGIYQVIYGLTPNTLYRVRGFMRTDALAEGRIGVRNYGGEDFYKSNSAHDWSEVTFTFKTGSNNTRAEIYAYKPAEAWGYTYVDDFGLTEVSEGSTATPNIVIQETIE